MFSNEIRLVTNRTLSYAKDLPLSFKKPFLIVSVTIIQGESKKSDTFHIQISRELIAGT